MGQLAGEHKGEACQTISHGGGSAQSVHPCLGQTVHQVLALGRGKPGREILRGDGANVINGGELRHPCLGQRLQRAKLGSQHLGGLLPYLANAKSEEQLGEVVGLGALNGGQQVLC